MVFAQWVAGIVMSDWLLPTEHYRFLFLRQRTFSRYRARRSAASRPLFPILNARIMVNYLSRSVIDEPTAAPYY
jgi:hypothetical protein